MTPNRSLAISNEIRQCKAGDIIGLMEEEFPSYILDELPGDSNSRNRVFTVNNTLLTMVLTAVQQDKTLKNSVNLYYGLHQKHKREALKKLEQQAQKERERDEKPSKKRPGRPKKYDVRLPKSLEKDISLNTAAYSKARARVPLNLVQDLFGASRIDKAQNNYTHWHGFRVVMADGTYVQMQDTKSIREDYDVKHHGKSSEGYPQGLLEVVMERGTGQVHCFKLSNRHVSELASFYDMIDELPNDSLLLIDDLYNCFEILAKCRRKGIEFVVPAKRKRNYETVETLANGDEIIKIKAPESRSKWLENHEKATELLLRRITCKSPEEKQYVLFTSILDREIDKAEIQQLYLTRWDVEIGIREVKTIMDVNVLRSKSPPMVFRELTVSLATYNLLRKIIYASIEGLPFSPEKNLIHQFYTFDKDILIDKKGRVYNRWSTGRPRTKGTAEKTAPPKTKTEPKV